MFIVAALVAVVTLAVVVGSRRPFDDHRFAFRDLRQLTAAVVELPVPELHVTLTPAGL